MPRVKIGETFTEKGRDARRDPFADLILSFTPVFGTDLASLDPGIRICPRADHSNVHWRTSLAKPKGEHSSLFEPSAAIGCASRSGFGALVQAFGRLMSSVLSIVAAKDIRNGLQNPVTR